MEMSHKERTNQIDSNKWLIVGKDISEAYFKIVVNEFKKSVFKRLQENKLKETVFRLFYIKINITKMHEEQVIVIAF